MRLPVRRRISGLKFNITPLIDVVFLLIIFFLVASHFVRNERVEAVELPQASQGESEEEAPRRLVVTITADGKMHVAGRVVEQPQLEQMILAAALEPDAAEFELRIRSDRDVPYETVEPILLVAARAGVSRVRFAVLPQ